jgi:2-aminobenzoylacetyl-CoA thioesterase
MRERSYRPGTLTPTFYLIGTPIYPAYLAMGEYGMIIEGGISSTAELLVKQIQELNISSERIKYIVLTHTHPDHIGAIPHLKTVWPHLKVIGSSNASKLLKRETAVKEFLQVDRDITENLLVRGEINEWPKELENYKFDIDIEIHTGEKIDLGDGTEWVACETPGHSICHMSYHNPKEGIVVIGDATGLFDPVRDIFWPNYFSSLEEYCNSIRKLSALSANVGVLSHNYILGDFKHHLQKAMNATESFHSMMLKRVNGGEDPEKVALDTAKWVYTFTNMQPFQTIHGLCKLMLKRSQTSASVENLFAI